MTEEETNVDTVKQERNQRNNNNNNNTKRKRERGTKRSYPSKKQKTEGDDNSSNNNNKNKNNRQRKKKNVEPVETETIEELDEDELMKQFKYLETWKHEKKNWKFNKVSQSRLIRQWSNINIFSKTHFKIFLEYASHMKGQARLSLFNDSKKQLREEKEKVKKDAIQFVLEFLDETEREKMKGMKDEEARNQQLLSSESAKKFMDAEMKDNTLHKRAKALYNVLVLTDEEQGGGILADESGVSDMEEVEEDSQ